MEGDQPYPHTYEGLDQLVRRLRGPDGCPWDREQTHDSLKGKLLEECYELVEAIEEGDASDLAEELGDVLFHVVFQIHVAAQNGEFQPERVFGSVIRKLVRRHPHVFGDAKVADSEELLASWDSIKRRERAGTGASLLDGVPRTAPALSYAQEAQRRAARAGFDWDDYAGVVQKVAEELAELESAGSDAEREAELGDLLFSVVNAARWLGVDAEGALRHANSRFYARFAVMERLSLDRGLSFAELPMEEKDALWEEAKSLPTASEGR